MLRKNKTLLLGFIVIYFSNFSTEYCNSGECSLMQTTIDNEPINVQPIKSQVESLISSWQSTQCTHHCCCCTHALCAVRRELTKMAKQKNIQCIERIHSSFHTDGEKSLGTTTCMTMTPTKGKMINCAKE